MARRRPCAEAPASGNFRVHFKQFQGLATPFPISLERPTRVRVQPPLNFYNALAPFCPSSASRGVTATGAFSIPLTDWERAFRKSFRKLRSSAPGVSKGLQLPSENFSPFLEIEDYQWLTGKRRAKKSPTAPWSGHGSRAAEANGRSYPARSPTRSIAYPACAACPRPSPEILAWSRLIDFEGGPQSSPKCPAQPARRQLATREHIMNYAHPVVKKNVDAYPSGSPFSRRKRPFVGARRRASIQRREHNTNIGRLSSNLRNHFLRALPASANGARLGLT